MSFFAVIDTNVLVSSLLSKNPDSATRRVVDAVAQGRIIPLYDSAILDEYSEVLYRSKFPFSKLIILGILQMIREFGVRVSPGPVQEALPDPDDVVFYAVVMEKRKTDDAYLVTGNLRHFPCQTYVVTPAEMMAILDAESGD